MSKEAAAGTADRKAAVARAKTVCPNPSQPPSWQVEAAEYLEQICHEEGPFFIQDGVQAGKASHALFRCTLCRDSNPMIKSSMESHRHGITGWTKIYVVILRGTLIYGKLMRGSGAIFFF